VAEEEGRVMAQTDERPLNTFQVSPMMTGGKRSQPAEDTEHHVRFRERHGEPGVAAICDGCPGWSTGLVDGHDLDAMARLESMHTGMKVTITREQPEDAR
jgi:hypothetical protein